MKWVKAEYPPELINVPGEWYKSVPVLVCENNGNMLIAIYEQVDEDYLPCWYSNDSERWLLKNVMYWMPLPLPPNTP